MSEQVKLILAKEIKKAKRNERSGNLLFFLGIVAVAVGFAISTTPDPKWIGSVIESLGVIVMIVGLGESLYYARKKGKLVKEFWATASKNPTCPNCGKAIPEGNYTFCPFCASPQKDEHRQDRNLHE